MTEHEIILTHILDCDRVNLHSDNFLLTESQQAELEDYKSRRLQKEPLQYILGKTNFFGLDFRVDPRVLIPRPETEIMVEHAINYAQELLKRKSLINILDIGTGSGNIAITLAKQIEHCNVHAIDLSLNAILLAKDNAEAHKMTHKIKFQNIDMKNFFKHAQKFDLIISNPPYIESRIIEYLQDEIKYEPRMALDGGDDGLKYCVQIMNALKYILADEGVFLMEIGDRQRPEIENIYSQMNSLKSLNFEKDYRQHDRIVIIQ